MYCNEKKNIRTLLSSFICTVLFKLKHYSFVRLVLDIVRCQLTGGYFRPCGPQKGVHVRLQEVSVCRRLKIWCFRVEFAGTTVRCPLMGDVRLQEVSLSEGLTLH